MEAGERITGNYESRERETIKRGIVEKLLVFSTLIGKWLQGGERNGVVRILWKEVSLTAC